MTSDEHREPCKTLQDTVKDLVEVKTRSVLTREWVEGLSDDIRKTDAHLTAFEISVTKQLAEFNSKLIAKTSAIAGCSVGGIVAVVEAIRLLLAK